MTEALLVSNALLWLAVVALALVVFALVRQIGVLHERVAPAGALLLAAGPKVGEPAPMLRVATLDGGSLEVGVRDPEGKDALLFFLSPTCPVCKSLLPALRSLARAESRRLRVLLASDGPRAEHEAFAREQALERFPYLLGAELGIAYGVGKLPYAALVDASGVLRARGLVNSREHLESLLEALDLGVESIQSFVARGKGAAQA